MRGQSKTRILLYLRMRKRSVGFILAAVLMSTCATAQFNDSVNHYFNIAATGNLNRTNSGTTYLFNNAAKFNINKKHIAVNNGINYIYGQNPSQKTNNDFLAASNIDFLKGVHKIYYWGLASYEHSFSLKVDHRLQAGGGVGYTFVNRPGSNLVISDGLLFEATDLMQPDKFDRTSYSTVRNSLRIKYQFLLWNFMTLEGTHFVQNSLSALRDYIIKSNTGISMKIYGALNLTMLVNYNRLNISETENLLMSYGLSYEKYF